MAEQRKRGTRGPAPKPASLRLRNVPHTEAGDRRAQAEELAAEFGVSVATVWRAASDLDRAREFLSRMAWAAEAMRERARARGVADRGARRDRAGAIGR